jgi:cyclophilin family peptidyl-prolyl cis-trans isomerase
MGAERGYMASRLSQNGTRYLVAAAVLLILGLWFVGFFDGNAPEPSPVFIPPSKEQVAVIETELGRIVWRFFPDHAPITVDNMKKMIEGGHYNNSHLYRAQSKFCLQGGLWNLRRAPFPPIKLEYNLPNKMGFISMARGSDPDSGSSEFSIMLRDNSEWLSPKGSDKYGYAVFAQVVEGWDVIQNIMKLPTNSEKSRIQMLKQPVKITSAYLSEMTVPLAFLQSNLDG